MIKLQSRPATASGLAVAISGLSAIISALVSNIAYAEDHSAYEKKIQALEQRIAALEKEQASNPPGTSVDEQTLNLVQEYISAQYRNRTESRSLSTPVQSREMADRVEHVLHDFVDIQGYFRAGYGRNGEGGPQVGFKAPGAMAKYRLGNEAENFGEVIFGKNFYLPNQFSLDPGEQPSSKNVDGPIAHVQFRMEFFNTYDNFSSGSNTNVALPEAWASIGNVISSVPSVKFWAGNRFYRRHDIGLNDFFFFNMSGGGIGAEDIPIGSAKLAVAWVGNGSTSGFTDLPQPDPENKAGFSKTNVDIRAYDINMLGGHLELGLIMSKAKAGLDQDGNTGPDSNGYSINAIHTATDFISHDGINKFTVQYGTEAAKTFSSGFETISLDQGEFITPDIDGSWRFRVTESFSANVNDKFSLGPVFIYQKTDQGMDLGTQTWVSVGVRPIYHFNNFINIALELGHDNVDDQVFDRKGHLNKITIAPQVTLGGRFNSRPAIRAFATWASWSDDFIGEVGGIDFASKSNGLTFGVQMESWW